MATSTKGKIHQVQEILTRRLKLKEPRFALERLGGRISGCVISASFKGKLAHARQRWMWDGLEKELGREAANEMIGTLLAYTPDEWDIELEGDTP